MSANPLDQPPSPAPNAALPDRLCTWCHIPMLKRLVAGGRFVHYTCPKCIFQHTTPSPSA